MSNPPECDREVYEKGEVVLVTHLPSASMEPWVVSVREASGQRVDWHYFGGRAVVKFIGDRARVEEAIRAAAPDFVERYRAHLRDLDLSEVHSHRVIAVGYGGFEGITLS